MLAESRASCVAAVLNVDELPLNPVQSLLENQFQRRTYAEKVRITQLGPDRPENINITQPAKEKQSYTRSFTQTWFDRKARI